MPTIDQSIALSACVAAFLSAFATFLTIREMARQRAASYRPELIISRARFRSFRANNAKDSYLAEFGNDIKSDTETFHPFSMPVRNLGLGAAKRVTISWSFPLDTFVDNLNNLAAKYAFDAKVERKGVAVLLTSNALGTRASMWENENSSSMDYVLPASFGGPIEVLQVPHTFTMLCSTWWRILMSSDRLNCESDLPSIIVTLEYYDITDNRYTAKFKLNIRFSLLLGSGSEFNGVIEVENV